MALPCALPALPLTAAERLEDRVRAACRLLVEVEVEATAEVSLEAWIRTVTAAPEGAGIGVKCNL